MHFHFEFLHIELLWKFFLKKVKIEGKLLGNRNEQAKSFWRNVKIMHHFRIIWLFFLFFCIVSPPLLCAVFVKMSLCTKMVQDSQMSFQAKKFDLILFWNVLRNTYITYIYFLIWVVLKSDMKKLWNFCLILEQCNFVPHHAIFNLWMGWHQDTNYELGSG